MIILLLSLTNCAMPLMSILPGTIVGASQGNVYQTFLSTGFQVSVYDSTGKTVSEHLLGPRTTKKQ